MCAVLALNSWRRRRASVRYCRQLGHGSDAPTNLAEIHRLDTLTTEGWADRGTRTRLTGADDELDDGLESSRGF
jgi:hypothetical protein